MSCESAGVCKARTQNGHHALTDAYLSYAIAWFAGAVMLNSALAQAWAEERIRVNAVAPGYIETAINPSGRSDLAHYQRIADRIAFKRWGQPEEIAGAVVFLCMPASQYATGTVVAVEGGFLAG